MNCRGSLTTELAFAQVDRALHFLPFEEYVNLSRRIDRLKSKLLPADSQKLQAVSQLTKISWTSVTWKPCETPQENAELHPSTDHSLRNSNSKSCTVVIVPLLVLLFVYTSLFAHVPVHGHTNAHTVAYSKRTSSCTHTHTWVHLHLNMQQYATRAHAGTHAHAHICRYLKYSCR